MSSLGKKIRQISLENQCAPCHSNQRPSTCYCLIWILYLLEDKWTCMVTQKKKLTAIHSLLALLCLPPHQREWPKPYCPLPDCLQIQTSCQVHQQDPCSHQILKGKPTSWLYFPVGEPDISHEIYQQPFNHISRHLISILEPKHYLHTVTSSNWVHQSHLCIDISRASWFI